MDFKITGRSSCRIRDRIDYIPRTGSADSQKNELKPHLKKYWCLSRIDGEFLARMEDVLDLYERPYDSKYPVICFDERPCQLIGEVLQPLKMTKGKVKRQHYGYKRNGTCALLVAFEPLTGKRFVEVVKRRTKKEYAHFMDRLAEKYPHAHAIRLVQDNLSTHKKGAFYEHLNTKRAFKLAQFYDFHFTPVKASWLNMVEIELSAIARMCLNRRIPTLELLTSEVNQLVKERNEHSIKIDWQFTKTDARVKLKKLYSNTLSKN